MKEIRSKYQRKILEEVEYAVEQFDCRKCDKPFMVDLDACEQKWDAEEFECWSIVYCPYCGHKHWVKI